MLRMVVYKRTLLCNLLHSHFLAFNRTDITTPDTFLDVNVVIGANSLLTYAAAAGDTTSTGAITFCTANSNEGRFVLSVEDLGAFIVQGCTFATVTEECMTVDLSAPSGGLATWNVNPALCPLPPIAGPDPKFYLTVANSNATYPELLVDPFFTQDARMAPPFIGAFDGSLRYGVVIGANGVLNVGPDAYLDYVGLSNNLCPAVSCSPGANCSLIDELLLTPNCPCTSSGTAGFIKLRNPSALIIDGWNFNTTAAPAAINLGVQSGIFFRSGIDVNGVVENPGHPFIYTIAPANETPGTGEYVFDVEGPLTVTGSNVSLTETLQLVDGNFIARSAPNISCGTIVPGPRIYRAGYLSYTYFFY